MFSQNMNKKEHCVLSGISRSSFEAFWNNAVKTITFKKTTASSSSKEAKNSNIMNPDTRNIIYKKNNVQIEMIYPNNLLHHLFNYIFAVRDCSQENRYFVGFAFDMFDINVAIAGMIVYFNSSGHSSTVIFNNILCSYDRRNGRIESNNSFLYNQTLLFTNTHRDCGSVILFMNLLSYEDTILSQCSGYFTDIKSSKISYEKRLVNINSRFLCIHDEDENYTSFDLGSLKLIKGKESHYLKLDSYNIDSDELDQFIGLMPTISPEKYGDGYPINCIKCNARTSIAIYGHDFMSIGLGNSYCNSCEIRYSKTENTWICCKLEPDNKSICSGELIKECICNKVHSTTFKIVVNKKVEGKVSLKYPYKSTVYMKNDSIY